MVMDSIEKKTEYKENNKMMKALINGITEAMALIDASGTILMANETCAKQFGTTPESLIGRHFYDELSPEIAKRKLEMVDKVIYTRENLSFIDEANGIYFSHNLFPLLDSEGKVTKIATLSLNITERQRIQEAFLESEERFRSIFENAANGITLASLDGYFFMVNSSMCNMVGYTKEELSNMSYQEITHPDDLELDSRSVQKLIKGKISNFQIEKRYIHKNGSTIWVLLSCSLAKDSKGNPFYIIGQVQDITSRKNAEEELRIAKDYAEKIANTDYLTGILNRRAFMNRLVEELSRTSREKSSISLILTDVDYFKKINDNYGHQVGDLALQVFVKCVLGCCRPYDFIGRHGGEEFIICLPNTTLDQAKKVAERIRKAVENLEISLENQREKIKITASFGIASPISGDEENVDSLIILADEAMYKAKVRGRNQICAANEEN